MEFLWVCCIIFVVILTFVIFKFLFCFFIIMLMEKIKGSKKNKQEEIIIESKNLKKNEKKFKKMILSIYGGLYRYFVFYVSKIPSNHIRKFIYKYSFHIKIGKKVVIHKGLEIRGGSKIVIGDGTIIGDDCILDGRGGLIIGKNVNLSSKVSIYTEQHDMNDLKFCSRRASVFINDRAWISANTIILPGVNVGEGTVLAAGAVATKDLDSFCLYAGIPGKKIKDRNSNIDYEFDGHSFWFY